MGMGLPPPPMGGLACGLFYKEGPLPMTNLDVKIHILNGVSKVTMV